MPVHRPPAVGHQASSVQHPRPFLVSVIGMDGVRYYGSHLQSIAPGIVPGARVRAGQLLGRIDNSGDVRTTPTHVHFGLSWPTPPGIWWIRRGLMYAWPYLDPGAPVATSLQFPRSRPPMPPPAATSHPAASAA